MVWDEGIGKGFLLEDTEQKQWYVYLSNNRHIMYTCRQGNEWTDHYSIDNQVIKDFSATIDSKGTIHVLGYTLARQLIYYQFNGLQWNHRLLERVYSRFQDIPYFTIVSSADSVHIMYYIESSLRRSSELLMHYYRNEDGWHGGKLWKFTSDDLTIPQCTFVDNDSQIHFIFTKRPKNELQLYYSVFNPKSLSWSNPAVIHNNKKDCHDYNLYIDQYKNIHLLWKEESEGTFMIKHLLRLNSEGSMGKWEERIIYKSQEEPEKPAMILLNRLYCLWREKGLIHFQVSNDHGVSWKKTETIKPNQGQPFTHLEFVSFYRTPHLYTIKTWGEGYPPLVLPLIDDIAKQGMVAPGVQTRHHTQSTFEQVQGKDHKIHDKINKELKSVKEDISSLKENINKMLTQFEQLYSTVYDLHQDNSQKTKSIYQMQAMIKKLNFEMKQVQDRISGLRNNDKPQNQEVETSDETQDQQSGDMAPQEENQDSISTDPEKVSLGNTTIFINPESDDDNC